MGLLNWGSGGTLGANYHTRTLENKQLAHSHFGKDASLRKISYVSCRGLYGGYSMTSNGSYWFFVSVYFPKSAPALPSGNERGGGGLGEGGNPSPICRSFRKWSFLSVVSVFSQSLFLSVMPYSLKGGGGAAVLLEWCAPLPHPSPLPIDLFVCQSFQIFCLVLG